MSKLRLSLTIPGAVSLGAYEGGVLAALLTAVRTLGEDNICIDSIAAASAGSITAVLTAKSLLLGTDPVALMQAAWVDNDSFKAMRTTSTDSPLSAAALTDLATALLGPDGLPDGEPMQSEPVRLSLSLTSLQGLTYELSNPEPGPAIQASTFQDWCIRELAPTTDSETYLAVAQYAIASGSNALGFPPKLIDRSGDAAGYAAAGLAGFPADGKLWYTDGGTTDNQPLGRTIDLASQVDSDDPRLFLLIHPEADPPLPSDKSPWGGGEPQPAWLPTLLHVARIQRSQSIYDDLNRLQKTNARLGQITALVSSILGAVDTAMNSAGLDGTTQTKLQNQLATALMAALPPNPASTTTRGAEPATDGAATSDSLSSVIESLVQEATGFGGKYPVNVAVVSPNIDTETGIPLAGSFLGHFGGFLDAKFRQSDFCRGYRDMQSWIATSLAEYLPVDVDLSLASDSLEAAYNKLPCDAADIGPPSISHLGFTDKLELGRLGLHVGHVVGHDIVSFVNKSMD